MDPKNVYFVTVGGVMIEKIIMNSKKKFKKGVVYNVFQCCIRPASKGRIQKYKDGKRFTACSVHEKRLLGKFKICKYCGKYVIGTKTKAGDYCTDCINIDKREHPRGLYCKYYIVDEYGCSKNDDCWTCKFFDPIFKNTGPTRRG